MSRIGKLPVSIPEKVTVSVTDGAVKVSGPKGTIEKSFNPVDVAIVVENNEVLVSPANNGRHAKAMYGTARSIINGMVTGVTKGFVKQLIITGVGFRAAVQGKFLNLNLGYSHDIKQAIPDGVNVVVTDNTKVEVSGYDKQKVGQFAAQVKKYYPVEPYKGKGVTIVGEHVRRKEGKKAG
jgi:large subunit ribosomal protein L6